MLQEVGETQRLVDWMELQSSERIHQMVLLIDCRLYQEVVVEVDKAGSLPRTTMLLRLLM